LACKCPVEDILNVSKCLVSCILKRYLFLWCKHAKKKKQKKKTDTSANSPRNYERYLQKPLIVCDCFCRAELNQTSKHPTFWPDEIQTMSAGWIIQTSISLELKLNHCSYMNYINNVFTTFLGLEICNDVAVNEGTESFHQKYLNLCSEDEQRSYGFGTT